MTQASQNAHMQVTTFGSGTRTGPQFPLSFSRHIILSVLFSDSNTLHGNIQSVKGISKEVSEIGKNLHRFSKRELVLVAYSPLWSRVCQTTLTSKKEPRNVDVNEVCAPVFQYEFLSVWSL